MGEHKYKVEDDKGKVILTGDSLIGLMKHAHSINPNLNVQYGTHVKYEAKMWDDDVTLFIFKQD